MTMTADPENPQENYGLSPREYAAYRLGLIDFMLQAVREGDLDRPSALIVQAFEHERLYRLRELQVEDDNAEGKAKVGAAWDEAFALADVVLAEEEQARTVEQAFRSAQ